MNSRARALTEGAALFFCRDSGRKPLGCDRTGAAQIFQKGQVQRMRRKRASHFVMENNSQEAEEPASSEANPVVEPRDTKRWGELGELAFVLKAASLGITASKPYGDRRPYDFLVEHGQRLLRIQVKSVFTRRIGVGSLGFAVAVSQNRYRGGRVVYTREEIDFIAAFVGPHDAWYLIPVDALGSRKFIHVYPAGVKRAGAGLFEQYREAWHLLKGA
jgi:PD-(D/E)XK endonuclease